MYIVISVQIDPRDVNGTFHQTKKKGIFQIHEGFTISVSQ